MNSYLDIITRDSFGELLQKTTDFDTILEFYKISSYQKYIREAVKHIESSNLDTKILVQGLGLINQSHLEYLTGSTCLHLTDLANLINIESIRPLVIIGNFQQISTLDQHLSLREATFYLTDASQFDSMIYRFLSAVNTRLNPNIKYKFIAFGAITPIVLNLENGIAWFSTHYREYSIRDITQQLPITTMKLLYHRQWTIYFPTTHSIIDDNIKQLISLDRVPGQNLIAHDIIMLVILNQAGIEKLSSMNLKYKDQSLMDMLPLLSKYHVISFTAISFLPTLITISDATLTHDYINNDLLSIYRESLLIEEYSQFRAS